MFEDSLPLDDFASRHMRYIRPTAPLGKREMDRRSLGAKINNIKGCKIPTISIVNVL